MQRQRGHARLGWSRRFLGAGVADVSAAFLAACGGGKETGTGNPGAGRSPQAPRGCLTPSASWLIAP
jgi:hypothetical protein